MRLIDADQAGKYLYEHLDDLHMMAAQNAIDEMPTIDPVKSDWIKCSDRLPEEHEDVLVAMNDGKYKSIHVGYAYNGGDWMIDGKFWHEEGDPSITHWMPLPDMPKEDDEDA